MKLIIADCFWPCKISGTHLIYLELSAEGAVGPNAGPLFLNEVPCLSEVEAVGLHGVGYYCGGRPADAHLAVHQHLAALVPRDTRGRYINPLIILKEVLLILIF